MRRLFPAALLLAFAACTSLAGAQVTTAPSSNWEMHHQIDELTAKVQALQADLTKLQTENDELKAKLAKTEQQLQDVSAKAATLVPTPIVPSDLLKDYPADKLPAPGEASNPLRVHAINDYLARQWANKPVTLAGAFLTTTVATDRAFTVRLGPPLVTTAPANALKWTADAAMPNTATDDIVRLKKNDPLIVTGTVLRVAYSNRDGKTAALAIQMRDCTIAK